MKETLNTRDEKLMNELWEIGIPTTASELAAMLEPKGWKKVTILKAIQSLVDEGYLEISGFEKTSTSYARKIVPAISKDEYYSSELLKKGVGVDSLADIAAALMGISHKKDKVKNAEIIKKMEEIIDRLQSENEELEDTKVKTI